MPENTQITQNAIFKLSIALFPPCYNFVFLQRREMFISTSDMSSNMIGERILQAMQKSDDGIIDEIKMGKAAFFGNVHLLSAMKARADETAQGKY
jgi:hypothetical protein